MDYVDTKTLLVSIIIFVGYGVGVQDIIPDVVGNGEDVKKMFNKIFSSTSRSSLYQSKEGVGVGFMIVYSLWAWG